LGRREELVLVAGTVNITLVDLLGVRKPEVVLSSAEVRASR